ncbi:MAG: hypothetical protein FJ280_01100 [Planctomycetes bacterium]|nr:hypothetical protein [Verrucomicrobiota bacterium]MBM4023996.1 hypothetical protein [Planctomycetota bacterium]
MNSTEYGREASVDFSFRSAFRDLSACPAHAGSWRRSRIADSRFQISEVGRTAPSGGADWRSQISDGVQIWSSRLKSGDWPLKPIGHDEELWAWTGQNFNGFLGYMADVLPLLKAGKTGFDVL